jgi:menaquinone-specific isochorismate synthase
VSPHLDAEITPDDHGPTTATEGSRITAFASPRRLLLGAGVALRIDVPAPWSDNVDVVTDALAAIEHDPDSPVRPCAFGALPYDRNRPATFVVPSELHARTVDGERWLLRIRGELAEGLTGGPGDRLSDRLSDKPGNGLSGGPGDRLSDKPGGGPDDRLNDGLDDDPARTGSTGVPEVRYPSEVTVRALQPPDEWCDAVATARDRIRAGQLVKVVLARGMEIQADVPFDAAQLWNRLLTSHDRAYVFAIDGFVGASPELLVSRLGSTVRAQPMAGTTSRSGHHETDQRRASELLTSAKNLEEHQITIDAVHDTLLPWCSYLDAEPTPSVVPAGPVQHLATLVEGRLSSPLPSVLDLVAALHPTPAVGGSPTAAALDLQAELEPEDRGRYAGPVGWVDAAGDGVFAVGIRSVQLRSSGALLHTGVGVVADSDPAAELAETRAKAQTLLGALIRP